MSNSSGRLRVLIDEMPLSTGIPTALDYVGRLIAGALALPLLVRKSGTQLETAGASAIDVSDQGRKLSFCLDRRHRWSSGSPITSWHYFEGLKRAAQHPYWALHMQEVAGVEIANDWEFTIHLKRSCGHFLHVLATPDLGPHDPDGAFSGLYREIERGSQSILLAPNPHSPDGGLPELEFILVRDCRDALSLWRSGQADVTCNTAFPFDELETYRKSPAFTEAASGIMMQIELGGNPHPLLLEYETRAALAQSIDREAIAVALWRGLSPAFGQAPGWMGLAPAGVCEMPYAASTRLRGAFQRPLVIGYHDYYPNRNLLELLCSQWKQEHGVSCEFRIFPFSDRALPDCDLMLILRFPPYAHPRASFEYSLGQVVQDTQLSGFLKADATIAASPVGYSGIEVIAAASTLIIPLFEIKSIFLKTARAGNFRYPDFAAFDFRGFGKLLC